MPYGANRGLNRGSQTTFENKRMRKEGGEEREGEEHNGKQKSKIAENPHGSAMRGRRRKEGVHPETGKRINTTPTGAQNSDAPARRPCSHNLRCLAFSDMLPLPAGQAFRRIR